jgi:hypothetical protein
MFMNAAIGPPSLPDYVANERNWPKIALLTHAIELSLKAFAAHAVQSGKPGKSEPRHHDLRGWYELAVHYGLKDDVSDNINVLHDLHEGHYARYPKVARVPDVINIADATAEHLIGVCTRVINRR